MLYILIIALLFALILGPQLWAKATFRRYSAQQDQFPGTGGELARHLLQKFELNSVGVEVTNKGDHYDPATQTVRLSPENHNGKSLTAIAVAAHEVGHAIQHAQNHPMLHLRSRLVKTAQIAEQASAFAFIGIPIVTAMTRAPSAGLLLFLVAIGSMFISTLVHLVTLPVELDASFGKAMPILKSGSYIDEKQQIAAGKVLRAAAFTYVAGSLASLLNLARWIMVLARR